MLFPPADQKIKQEPRQKDSGSSLCQHCVVPTPDKLKDLLHSCGFFVIFFFFLAFSLSLEPQEEKHRVTPALVVQA